jgi:hypothetical protein
MRRIAIVFASALLTLAAGAAEIRYAEVAYLDELGVPPVRLEVLRRTPISLSRDLRSAMAYLPKRQRVRLVGWSRDLFYVEGRIATGPAIGWVSAAAVEKPSLELVAELQRRHARREHHRELIARQEIAVGMTRDEVQASLGKPDRTVTVRTAGGEQEQWIYLTYRYVPQYHQYRDDDGRWRQSISYRRVPTGHRLVVFGGREVVLIEDNVEAKSTPRGAPGSP